MSKKKIFIVDDEEAFTRMVKQSLEETGRYEVRVENKGIYALTVAKSYKPDIIFLDIIMPDISGGEVAHNLKNNATTKDIPVIFLTGMVSESEVSSHDGMIGGHPFLAKPVNIDDMTNCIETNLPT